MNTQKLIPSPVVLAVLDGVVVFKDRAVWYERPWREVHSRDLERPVRAATLFDGDLAVVDEDEVLALRDIRSRIADDASPTVQLVQLGSSLYRLHMNGLLTRYLVGEDGLLERHDERLPAGSRILGMDDELLVFDGSSVHRLGDPPKPVVEPSVCLGMTRVGKTIVVALPKKILCMPLDEFSSSIDPHVREYDVRGVAGEYVLVPGGYVHIDEQGEPLQKVSLGFSPTLASHGVFADGAGNLEVDGESVGGPALLLDGIADDDKLVVCGRDHVAVMRKGLDTRTSDVVPMDLSGALDVFCVDVLGVRENAYILISFPWASLVLASSDDGLEDVSEQLDIIREPTLLFAEFGDGFVQVCPSGVATITKSGTTRLAGGGGITAAAIWGNGLALARGDMLEVHLIDGMRQISLGGEALCMASSQIPARGSEVLCTASSQTRALGPARDQTLLAIGFLGEIRLYTGELSLERVIAVDGHPKSISGCHVCMRDGTLQSFWGGSPRSVGEGRSGFARVAYGYAVDERGELWRLQDMSPVIGISAKGFVATISPFDSTRPSGLLHYTEESLSFSAVAVDVTYVRRTVSPGGRRIRRFMNYYIVGGEDIAVLDVATLARLNGPNIQKERSLLRADERIYGLCIWQSFVVVCVGDAAGGRLLVLQVKDNGTRLKLVYKRRFDAGVYAACAHGELLAISHGRQVDVLRLEENRLVVVETHVVRSLAVEICWKDGPRALTQLDGVYPGGRPLLATCMSGDILADKHRWLHNGDEKVRLTSVATRLIDTPEGVLAICLDGSVHRICGVPRSTRIDVIH
ncbi:hypothetical protein PYCC9005_004599 [Savitreella phatthalungensis]